MNGNDADNGFEEFYKSHYPLVYKFCYAHLKDPHLASECCQDVFLTYLKKKPEFPSPAAERAWLLRTARNLVLRTYRRIALERQKFQSYSDENAEWVNRLLAYEEDYDRLFDVPVSILEHKHRVLHTLTQQEKELYDLFYTQRKNCREIAEYFGINENAVYQRLYRLRTQIQSAVKELRL